MSFFSFHPTSSLSAADLMGGLMFGGAETGAEVCIKAPEWAEHLRFDAPDQPCDDGRSGRI